MKTVKIAVKVLALGALFAVAAPLALADSVGGVVNVSGHDSFTTSTLTFISPFASSGDSGLFSSYSNGTVDYFLGTVNYMDTVYGPLKTFSITNSSGDVLTFYDTSNNATSGVNPSTNLLNIVLDETGYYTINGGPEQAGFFDLDLTGQSADGSDGGLTFQGSGGLADVLGSDPLGVASEPAAGFLLGSGLLGIAGLLYTRRRKVQTLA